MKTQEIIENNKLIAEFIGMQETSLGWYDNEDILKLVYDPSNTFDDLLFHKSFDWLMPIVEEIEDMGYPNETIGKSSTFYKGNSTTKIWNDEFIGKTKHQSIYKAVIEFIKWYNENK